MNIIKRFKRVTALPLLMAMVSPDAFAHTGHVANESLHSLLHVEHIIVLLTAAIAFGLYVMRNK